MARRKTFDVTAFKNYVNCILANDYISFEVKNGMAEALDHVLHETGNYRGFRYLESFNSEDPEFGIVKTEIGYYLSAKKAIRREYF